MDRFCRDDLYQNPDCLLTNASGAYGTTIAEHSVMVSLMLLRRQMEYTEIIRAGIQAVDKGQMEGARSCGMTNAQAMRYVVMPQAVKVDSHMALEIFDIPNVGTLEIMGRVARCQRVMLDEEHAVYHVGLFLENLSRRTLNAIVRYLFSEQRRAIAKGIEGRI